MGSKYKHFIDTLSQGFLKCGTRATSATSATLQWYTGIARKNQRIKKQKFSFNKYSYVENLINLYFI
jgi:hypothetical protein